MENIKYRDLIFWVYMGMDEILNIFGTKVSKCVSSIPTFGQWWKFKRVFSKLNKEAIKLGQGHFVKR